FVQDMHQHLATDYVTGEAVVPWYGVNDMAIVRCAQNYLRVTGDLACLDKRLHEKTALGDLLLHATAGMNAGNVSSMRFVADLLERRGNSSHASQLRAEAKNLAQRINEKLYVPGKGWWKCGQPDGSFLEVRHCYDFLSVLDNMLEDLSDAQKREMSGFFWEQLHSNYWMRALSPDDVDATWNIRPDHS